MGFGSTTLQEQVLCGPLQHLVGSSVREFESFQTVSPHTAVDKGAVREVEFQSCLSLVHGARG